MRKFLYTATVLATFTLAACANMPGFNNHTRVDQAENPFTKVDPDWKGYEGAVRTMPEGGNLGPYTVHTPRGEGSDIHPDVSGSGDNTWLYFASDRDGASFNIYRKRPTGAALEMITTRAGDEYWPRVSPDGRWLAFGADWNGDWDLYVLNLRDLNQPPMLITSDSRGDDIHPTWSFDSDCIVYASWSDMVGSYILKSVTFGPMDGATPASFDVGDLADSNDGAMLCLAELPGMGSDGGTSTMDMQGYPPIVSFGPMMTNQQELITGIHPDYRPISTANGANTPRQVVYQDYRKSGKRWNGLRIFDLSSGAVSVIASGEDCGAIQPRWSHDGSAIVYTTVAKTDKCEKGLPSGGDGFAITSVDGRRILDLRNPTHLPKVGDPVWVRYLGESRIFFSARDGGKESILSVKIGK